MSYIGYFRDNDQVLYTVDIITSVAETTEVVLSETPFVTSMEESKDHIYQPARYHGATVGIVSDDYLPDIYSGTAHGTLVRLKRGTSVVWVGYATPCLYTMGYSRPLETVEVECIDALSTLQYIKYTTADKAIVTFRYIIDKCLAACGVYTDYYVADTFQFTNGGTGSAIDELVVSEGLFFGKKSVTEVDDDVAWTMQEVLEQLCRYMGLTMFAEGTSVYFADYDAVGAGRTSYYRYVIGNSTGAAATAGRTVAVTGASHARTGATISLADVYNVIKVRDSLYTFEGAVPSFFDNVVNITQGTDPDVTETTYQEFFDAGEGGNIGEIVSYVDDSENKYMECLFEKYTSVYAMAIFAKWYRSSDFAFHLWQRSGSSWVSHTETAINWTEQNTYVGAFLMRMYVDNVQSKWYDRHFTPVTGETTVDTLMRYAGINHVDLDEYICLSKEDSAGNLLEGDDYAYPMIETTVADLPALFGGEHAYLLISGSYLYQSVQYFRWPTWPDGWDLDEGRYAMKQEDCYLPCRLQWGGMYWNGEEWTSTVSNFKLYYFDENSEDSDRRADATMGKFIEFVNTVTWRAGTDDKGYLIPMPVGRLLLGKPLLTIYKPHDPEYVSTSSGSSYGTWYKHKRVFLKDFKIKAIVSNPAMEGEEDTDTEYFNVINRANASELGAIEFKVCTWDFKKPNYSCVARSTGGTVTFVQKTFNPVLYAGEQAWEGSDDDAPAASNGLRQEEHLIYRLWNQYQQPAVKLAVNLHGGNSLLARYTVASVPGKYFICDAMNIDYRNGVETLKLIEKK